LSINFGQLTTCLQADILVSELLGSWGDNELSPECLDGAQRFLKEGGISIPCDYTSYLVCLSARRVGDGSHSQLQVPIAAHKVYTDVSTHKEDKALETPYVVLLHNHSLLSTIEPLFKFDHPNPACSTSQGPDNSRYHKIQFVASNTGLMHGFGGYFDSKLYGDVYISKSRRD